MKEVIYVMLYLERRLARIELNLEQDRGFHLRAKHRQTLKALATVYNYIMETQ